MAFAHIYLFTIFIYTFKWYIAFHYTQREPRTDKIFVPVKSFSNYKSIIDQVINTALTVT
jgi:hypothetical protein